MGVVSAPASAGSSRVVPAVVMRALPVRQLVVAKADPVAAPREVAKKEESVEAIAPPEGVPSEAAAEPIEAKVAVEPAPVVPAPVVVEAEPPAPKPVPEPAAARPPAPRAPRPSPSGEGVGPATGGAPGAVGQFNLRASDTAEVVVDGKRVGRSPVLGFKVKPGRHKVRFDCYDASGVARPGVSQTYDIAADYETDVEYDCPTE